MTAAPISTSTASSTSPSSSARPRRDRPVREHSLGNGFHASPDPYLTTWVGKLRMSTKLVLEREARESKRTVAYIIRELVEGWVEEVEGARRKREEKEEKERKRARK